MRPVLLEFTGLHSYREQQAVDFAELGAYGIFGVFGPTGSGKSTILDAITLALFGKVDRADRGTRAIINQQEKQANVAFTFDLAGARYRVERTYERDPAAGPNATRTRRARLVTIVAGSIQDVLADKPAELDRRIAALLGMSMEDFTRAVVLPQGQFDKFLKLTDGERAKMLEHIFCLEQYGDGLTQKARARVGTLTAELQAIAAEEQGLGDASEEAVARVKKRAADCAEVVAAKQAEKARAGEELAAQAELKRLDDEKQRLLLRKDELDAESTVVDENEAQLDAASKAEPLRGWIYQEKTLAERARQAKRDLESMQAVLPAFEEAAREAAGERAASLERHEKEAPAIQRRLQACETATADERERAEAAKLRDGKSAPFGEVQKRLDRTQAEVGERNAELKLVKEKLARLADERNRVAVSAEERQAVGAALAALTSLEAAEKQAREAEETLAKKNAVLGNRRAALRTVLGHELDEASVAAIQLDAVEAGELAYGVEADEAVEAVARAIRVETVKLITEARSSLRAVEAERQEVGRRNLAGILAAELAPGAPCPVCGSHDHPEPALPAEDIQALMAEAEGRVEGAHARYDAVTAWDKEVERSLAAWRAAFEEVAETSAPKAAREREALACAAKEFERLRGDWRREELRPRQKEMVDADLALARADELRAVKEGERESCESKLRALAETANRDAVLVEGLKTEIIGLDERIGALTTKVNAVTGGRALTELRAELERKLTALEEAVDRTEVSYEAARAAEVEALQRVASLASASTELERQLAEARRDLADALRRAGFESSDTARAAMLDDDARAGLARQVDEYRSAVALVARQLEVVERGLGDKVFDEKAYLDAEAHVRRLAAELEEALGEAAVAAAEVDRLRANHDRWRKLEEARKKAERDKDLAGHLAKLLEGRRFVQFLAEEHLRDMVVEASRRLGALTGQRYALELDEGCGFLMRDDFMGGQRRPVGSLSGGETFLTSLALALALSGKIQLRGRFPLGFFFLDEGFGTLDREKLDLVMATLEKLHDSERMVGVISHVPELREQLPVYLEVHPADAAGRGSRVTARRN